MLIIFKKISIFTAISLFFLLPAFSLPALAQTAASDQTGGYGLEETRNTGVLNSALINNTPQQIVGTVISAVLALLGVVFFLLVLYAGFRWMLAQGNESEVEAAKQILIAATIGLVIVLSAYAVTAFIGGQLTGSAEQVPAPSDNIPPPENPQT